MLTKEAAKKLEQEIDRGFIEKCAEYGFDYSNSQDREQVHQLMGCCLEGIRQGKILIPK